jgi:hypothetical protein
MSKQILHYVGGKILKRALRRYVQQKPVKEVKETRGVDLKKKIKKI